MTSIKALITGAFLALLTSLPALSAPYTQVQIYHVIATASDNHATIKPLSGWVWDIDATAAAASQYIRLYNYGAGFNGCNSASNLVWGQGVPSSNSGFVRVFPVSLYFPTGIAVCITGGGAVDTDTTAAATTTVVNIGYQ